MRDASLDRGNAYLASLRSACDVARREVDAFPDAEFIVSSFAKWCRDVLFTPDWMDTRGENGGLSGLVTLPSSQSPFRSLQRVLDPTLRASLEEALSELLEGRNSNRSNVAAWLLGRAFARGLVAEMSEAIEGSGPLFTEIRSLIGSQDIVQCAFEEALAETLRDSPSARAAMLSLLESWVSDINAKPEVGTYSIDRNSFRTLVDEWRTAPSIAALWTGREAPFPVHYDVLETLPNILPIDRSEILECLDGFRFPEPLRQVLRHPEILHDRDEIAAILADSPLCSNDGRSWNGSLLALLVLRTAEGHCRALWKAMYREAEPNESDAKAAVQVKETLSSWIESLGHIVMGRSDGRFLGSQWLFMKVADERFERARRHRTGDPRDRFIGEVDLTVWISQGLSGAGLSAEDVASLVDLPEITVGEGLAPARRAPHRDEADRSPLAALSVMCLLGQLTGNATIADEERELFHRLDALLASRDAGFESELNLHASGHGLPASRLGCLLADQDLPAERWRQSWELLAEQRRRVQHWRYNQDGDALAPSLFLLAIGLAGIDWLLEPSVNRRNAAKGLWREVFDGARDCWLTVSVSHLLESVETCIGRLFARHPRVFRELPGERDASGADKAEDSEDYCALLARDLDHLGGHDRMLAVCCLNAGANGASPAAMDDVLRRNSGHLDAVLKQFERWQSLERDVLKRPEIVEALAALRQEVAGVASERLS